MKNASYCVSYGKERRLQQNELKSSFCYSPFSCRITNYILLRFVFDGKRIDVMAPFARIYGDYNEYWQNFTWQKLVTYADYYGYDWGSTKAHGALADALATLYCYKKILAHNRA